MAEGVRIAGKELDRTSKAIQWETATGDDVWFPMSAVNEIHPDCIVVEAWIAKQKGLT